MPDKFTGMKAILNVNDESGNPVELSSIEAKTLTGIAYPETKQPGFKRYKTKVTFEPFIVKENYTYEEPQIKIKQIVAADDARITDLSGNNEYDYASDLTGINTNSVFVDVIPPDVRANLEPNEGVYTPVAEKSEGEKIIQFYFPYEVSKRSDADEESDVIGILGSFHWYNGTGDPDEEYYKFMYAVTASPNPPEDDDIAKDQYDDGWHVGYTGFYSNNPIKQISSNNYLHIRLIDDVDYNLESTTLEIIANDYAGASANESFMLDFTGDGKKPSIPAANVQKVYDDATKTGTMTVNVNVTDDNSGLKGIWYMWVSRGSDAPASDDPGWTEVGSFNQGDNSVAISVEKQGITSFTGDLYIKAVDVFSNELVEKVGTYTYSVEAPEYNVAYSEKKTVAAELDISDIPSDNAVAVLIKIPDRNDDTYFVSIIDDDSYSGGDIFDNDSLMNTDFTDVYSWQVYKVTTDDGKIYEFEHIGSADSSNYHYTLNRIFDGEYYGELNITLLAGSSPEDPSNFDLLDYLEKSSDGSEPVSDVIISDAFTYKINIGKGLLHLIQAGTEASPVYPQEFTIKLAPGVANVYSASITTTDTLDKLISYRRDRSPGIMKPSHGFDPDDRTGRMLSTLDGVKIDIEIENLLNNDWGIDDIDFQKSYIEIIRVTDERLTNYDGNTYAIVRGLERKVKQTVILPAADYPSGRYELKLHLIAAASGKDYTFGFDNDVQSDKGIFVDGTKESEKFGFAGYSYSFQNSNYGLNANESKYYGPVYGIQDEAGNPITEYSESNNPIYIPVNSGEDKYLSSMRLYFTVDDMPEYSGETTYEIIGARAIKAWNVTEGVDDEQSRSKAAWYYAFDASNAYNSKLSYYIPVFVEDADDVLGAYRNDETHGYLPLIKNKLNTVAIQVINANGLVSQVKYIYIEPVDAEVSGSLSITNTNKLVKEGKLTFKPSQNQPMDAVKSIYIYDYIKGNIVGDIINNYDFDDNSYSLALTESGYHLYRVYAVDNYGNYTILGEKNWEFTDAGKPILVSSEITNDANGYFKATYHFTETSWAYGMDQTLRLYFDDPYMDRLGDGGDPANAGFTMTLHASGGYAGTNVEYQADKADPYGIYKVETTRNMNDNQNIYITVYGVIKYDSSLAEDENVSHTIYATLIDPFGYESDPGTGLDIEVTNTKPQYVSGYLEKESTYGYSTIYRFVAEFNTPVMLDESLGTNVPSSYSEIKNGELPIFNDGYHTISFYDIFGTKWTQEIEVKDQFNEHGILIYLSETDYTSESVEVTIKPVDQDNTYCMVYDTASNNIGDSWAPFTVDNNMTLVVMIKNYNSDLYAQESIYITNILKGAPQAELHWYYNEFKSDSVPEGVSETTQPVTVWYTSDRIVTPTGGTTSSYTFYPGATENSYTFEFVDLAGNIGQITATLPISITGSLQPDEKAPEYEIFIYARKNGKDEFRADTTSTSLEDAIVAAGYVQGYNFDIAVTEDSPYKIVILSGKDANISGVTYNSSSAQLDGVTQNKNRITVTKAAPFTVVIVDKFNNKSSFTIEVGDYLDNTPPKATVEKIYDKFVAMDAYVTLSDKSDNDTDTQNVKLLSPVGMELMNDGRYYYRFTDSGTFMVTFMDMAGNMGSTSITVDSLNNNAPIASVKWSPCYEDGYTDETSPPNKLTNSDVMATVKYDKSVVVAASYSFNNGETWTQVTDGTASNEFFTLKTSPDTAAVTFHQGGLMVKLDAAALNEKTTTTELRLDDVIVKTPPAISRSVIYNYREGYESGAPVSATITFTPESIDVFCSENPKTGSVIKVGDSISFTVFRKGEYTYHFTDIVGNQRTLTVDIDRDMDRTAPEITIDTGDGSVTGGNVTITVSVNEDVMMTVTGAGNAPIFSGNVSKGDKQVNIPTNGSYEVTAVDGSGNKTTSIFTVGNIDKTAPVLAFDPVTINIRQDSRVDDLQAILSEGVIVTDNKSESNNIDVDWNITGVDLARTGVYNVVYTAVDEAGNPSTVTRFVRVYSKDELDVLINGMKTFKDGTITVNSKNIKITVTNPLGTEPYTIYLRKNIRYEGQMKYDYTIIRPDANGSFSVPSDSCYYTLYIVTQSRQTYITRIYVAREAEVK